MLYHGVGWSCGGEIACGRRTELQAFYCYMDGLDEFEIQMRDGHVCYGYGLD